MAAEQPPPSPTQDVCHDIHFVEACFFLYPDNKAAGRAVNAPENGHLVQESGGHRALRVDFQDVPDGKFTFGRSGCHITLPNASGAGIERTHCYFKYNRETGAVVIRDLSANRTTQVSDRDEDLIVPLSQVKNSVLVTRGFNRNLFIGNGKYYKFRIGWDASNDRMKLFLSKYPNQFGPDRDPTQARYLIGDLIGHGSFGVVWKAVNIHTGEAMAVKRFTQLYGKRDVMAIREINNLFKLNSGTGRGQEHIVPIIDMEYDRLHFKWIEFFMPLKRGSVTNLVLHDGEMAASDDEIGNTVLYHMTKALCWTERHGIIHRDIKPDNILYDIRENNDGVAYFHYMLSDFNLSHESAKARSRVGTPQFMAPEVYSGEMQSVKTDIWSLFATIVWIYNADNFREFNGTRQDLVHTLFGISQSELFINIRDMAYLSPNDRISARRLLSRLEGRSDRVDEGEATSSRGHRSHGRRRTGGSRTSPRNDDPIVQEMHNMTLTEVDETGETGDIDELDGAREAGAADEAGEVYEAEEFIGNNYTAHVSDDLAGRFRNANAMPSRAGRNSRSVAMYDQSALDTSSFRSTVSAARSRQPHIPGQIGRDYTYNNMVPSEAREPRNRGFDSITEVIGAGGAEEEEDGEREAGVTFVVQTGKK